MGRVSAVDRGAVVSAVEDNALAAFQHVATTLQWVKDHPHGPEASPEDRQVAGQACVQLCDGDQDRARTLWKLIAEDCGGYMPRSAALTLIRAARTGNLVPDVEPPELS